VIALLDKLGAIAGFDNPFLQPIYAPGPTLNPDGLAILLGRKSINVSHNPAIPWALMLAIAEETGNNLASQAKAYRQLVAARIIHENPHIHPDCEEREREFLQTLHRAAWAALELDL
jgi:hypothetical protein